MIKFGVTIFPGSNCDLDAIYVVENIIKKKVIKIWHNDKTLPDVDCIIIPGGFSFGDYLRPGAIASRSPVIESIEEFGRNGGLILGICNGFQILTEANILPGVMLRNDSTRFISKKVKLRVLNNNTPFTNLFSENEIIELPIAHKDGNYYAHARIIEELKTKNRIIFSYCENPNGSVEDIAGILNEEGNILGMMPHPERAYDSLLGSEWGRKIFESIVNYLEDI